ncbi:MAG TPA: dihydrofolate reductase [Candidatus Saccharimonadales bacterium]|nr:dihydrofolate reductase [Candidatus Saccharimonadales bacterium]
MNISIIVTRAQNNVIGSSKGTPWYLPADLVYFKRITTGHPIIMGRKTHQNIGRALKERRNIVITRNQSYTPSPGAEVAHSLEEALSLVDDEDQVFIIGGESIFKQALPQATRLYLNTVKFLPKGDRFFEFDPRDWRLISSETRAKDQKNPYDFKMEVYERA